MPESSEPDVPRIDHRRLREQLGLMLAGWAVPNAAAARRVEAIVETDLRAIDSHGVSMLPLSDAMGRSGRLNVTARPRLVRAPYMLEDP